MATATTTATGSLTPAQQAAREFWRQAGADRTPPFYVMSQYYAQLSANSDNLPLVTAALEQLLTGLGYATDVDTIFSEFAAGQAEELGYWAGRYSLFDSDGNRFDLVAGRNGATLTVPPALVPAGADMAGVTVLSGDSFSAGALKLANPQFQISLRFTLPVSDATLDAGAAAFASTAPLCTGTFAVVGGGAAGSRLVNGKRGAWTQAGVNQAADGDPAAAWYGQYILLDVTEVTAVVQAGGTNATTASVVQVPEPVYLYNDPSFGLTFQWEIVTAVISHTTTTCSSARTKTMTRRSMRCSLWPAGGRGRTHSSRHQGRCGAVVQRILGWPLRATASGVSRASGEKADDGRLQCWLGRIGRRLQPGH